MMAPQFSRSLQTALQDNIGGTKWKTNELDRTSTVARLQGSNIMGYISNKRRGLHRTAVYDSSCLAPDVGRLSREKQMIWVNANSVYGRGEKVTRPIDVLELFAI